MQIFIWLCYGLILAAPLIYLANKGSKAYNIRLLGIALIAAAFVYVAFAITWGTGEWVLIELLGVPIYALFYFLAKRYSVYYLALGWLLHPIWDIVLHYCGPGSHIAPQWYAIACISFDIAVASYLCIKWRTQSSY